MEERRDDRRTNLKSVLMDFRMRPTPRGVMSMSHLAFCSSASKSRPWSRIQFTRAVSAQRLYMTLLTWPGGARKGLIKVSQNPGSRIPGDDVMIVETDT